MTIFILGKGGHAKVVADMVPLAEQIGIDEESMIMEDDILYVGVGIGIDCGVPKDHRRMFEKFPHNRFPPALHPDAAISPTAEIGDGTVVCARAVVGVDAKLGKNVLVNTGAQIDHDCEIGNHTVIAPGVIICGGVKLGKSCTIGVGAIIVQRVELPDETRVPGGTLVVGQDDFRKPLRVVWNNGADTLKGLTPTAHPAKDVVQTVSIRLNPDPQQG
tara:strand:- start:2041 stop:2691 length:651 start_codon:yes stop_codon:yes gene_type:complete